MPAATELRSVGIGSAINRVDGLAKVTGKARYAAEHPVPRAAPWLGRFEHDRERRRS